MNWPWKKKKEEEAKHNITGQEICRIYYTLQNRYDGIANNIAIIKNKKKFDYQVRLMKERINAARGDKMLQLSDERYTFIIADRETTLVHIRSLEELENCSLYFKKYM